MSRVPLNQIAKNASRKFDFNNFDEVVFINTGDVLHNEFLHNELTDKNNLPGQAKKAIKKGDILYSEIRPGNGRYLLVDRDLENHVVSTKFMVIESDTNVVLPEYLFLVLTSQEVTEYFKVIAESRSGTFPQITFDAISHYEIDLPNIEIQKSIIDKIFLLNDKIQLNTQTNQTLEQIAQAIFKSWFVDFDPVKAKIDALANGGTHADAERAAMQVISGKTNAELTQMQQTNPDAYKTLEKTAALFPSEMVESELGDVPKGWGYCKVGDVVDRLKNPQKLKKDDISEDYSVPVFEQGSNILMGYTQVAGFEADIENPMFIFGDHTCVTHLSTTPFSSYQNVITLKGFNLSTYWVYWAVRDKQKFQEYRRHWMEFIVKDIIVPDNKLLCDKFSERVKYFHKKIDENTKENQTLSEIRDSLLPRLLSGEFV